MRSLTVISLKLWPNGLTQKRSSELRVANSDVARHTLCEMEATHGAQPAGEALLAALALGFHVLDLRSSLLWLADKGFLDGVGHV